MAEPVEKSALIARLHRRDTLRCAIDDEVESRLRMLMQALLSAMYGWRISSWQRPSYVVTRRVVQVTRTGFSSVPRVRALSCGNDGASAEGWGVFREDRTTRLSATRFEDAIGRYDSNNLGTVIRSNDGGMNAYRTAQALFPCLCEQGRPDPGPQAPLGGGGAPLRCA